MTGAELTDVVEAVLREAGLDVTSVRVVCDVKLAACRSGGTVSTHLEIAGRIE